MFISKSFEEDENGFIGSYEGYVIDTNKENLKNWLESEVSDNGAIYDAIKHCTDSILIIKNLNIEEEFQGQGYGSEILTEMINESGATSAILLSDMGESQKPNFVLEKFYESHDFSTISQYNKYPLMVYPSDLAERIKQQLNNLPSKKLGI